MQSRAPKRRTTRRRKKCHSRSSAKLRIPKPPRAICYWHTRGGAHLECDHSARMGKVLLSRRFPQRGRNARWIQERAWQVPVRRFQWRLDRQPRRHWRMGSIYAHYSHRRENLSPILSRVLHALRSAQHSYDLRNQAARGKRARRQCFSLSRLGKVSRLPLALRCALLTLLMKPYESFLTPCRVRTRAYVMVVYEC